MIPPEIPHNERARLQEVLDTGLLDTPPELRFDRIVRIVRYCLRVPIAAFSIIDSTRQFFKSIAGLESTGTPREVAFCAHTINEGPMIINDASQDPRFQGNSLVTGDPYIRFYAGIPVKSSGLPIGALCAIDTRPREMSVVEEAMLIDLASLVEDEINVTATANHDPLTGVLNRRGFFALTSKLLSICARSKLVVSVIAFDLDGLKAVNDTRGHLAGDAFIRGMAEALSATFRDSDVVGRMGGDEFMVTAVGLPDGMPIDRLRERYGVQFSYGIASTLEFSTLTELLANADRRMYDNKFMKRKG